MRHSVVASLAVREWGDPALPGVLLWPGLGSTGGYFTPIVAELPCRAVVVDPPGHGDSAPLEPCTFERLVEIGSAVVEQCRCVAFVGHSLAAYVAVGVACAPPAGLQTVVLLDGGFMEAEDMAAFGMPITEGRGPLTEWLAANLLRFPSWEAAVRQLATMIGGEEGEALNAYVREVFVESDDEIRERQTPERAADLLLATFDHEARALAEKLAIPTLLVASGQPAEVRAVRQRAWEAFASASPLAEVRVFDNWGHNPIFQQPEVLASLIESWISEHLAPTRAGPGASRGRS